MASANVHLVASRHAGHDPDELLPAVARLSRAMLAGAPVPELERAGLRAITQAIPGAEAAVDPGAPVSVGDPLAAVVPLGTGDGAAAPVLVVRAPGPLTADERAFAESVGAILASGMARARVAELEERARRWEALAATGQLAAGVAHDVNNVVTVIKLYAELMESESVLDQAARDRLHAIRTQADRAVSLAWQVLDTAHRQPLQLDDLDLVPFLHDFTGVVGGLLPEGVHLSLRCARPTLVVRADPTRLQQVMTNLVANAGQALAGGGTLTIEVAPVEDRGRAWTRIDVADTGPGIPPDVLPRVFEPFFTTKAAGKGSGLGLPQVQALAGAHGGHVTIRSAVGEGTVVSVWLPGAAAGEDRTAGGPAGPERLPRGAGQLVLVVEDDPVLREALTDVLAAIGYRCEAVADGEDALAWLAGSGRVPAVVVSDVAMPGLGGEGLARRMAEGWPHVPVLLTAPGPSVPPSPPNGQGRRLTRLTKPFSIEQLADALATAQA